jgi:hypothetical protein
VTDRSELAILVETEVELDRAVAHARRDAAAAIEAATLDAKSALESIEVTIARERAKLAASIEAESRERARRIEDAAAAAVARYDAVRGDALVALARRIARRVAVLAEEDP